MLPEAVTEASGIEHSEVQRYPIPQFGQFWFTAARHGLRVMRTSDGSKSSTTTASKATSKSPRHPFVSIAASVLSLRFTFDIASASFGMLLDRPQVNSSERSSAQLHADLAETPGGGN